MEQTAGAGIVGAPPWEAVAETMPVATFVLDSDGHVSFVNRAWRSLMATAGFALGRSWLEDVAPPDVAAAQSAWHRARTARTAFELPLRMRGGAAERWVLLRAVPAVDPGATGGGWCATLTDIQALKEFERQREASEREFRALADAAPVILWTATADGGIDWYNRRWFEYTGMTRAEAAGWGWQQAHHPEDFPEVMRRWPASIATGEPFEMEFRLRGADRSFHWFLTRVQPLLDESGAVVRWYGSNVDVDLQRRDRDRSARIAETLQAVYLPKRLPHDDRVRFDAVYRPAETDALVGGDWYDAFELADGRIAFSIGDVGGHGLEASIVAGSLRQAIIALTFRSDDPAEILVETNTILSYQFPDTLATAIVGFVDRERRFLRYANAGHPPPIVALGPATAPLDLPYGTLPLGVRAELGAVETTSVELRDGAVVAVFTDGLIEAGRDIAAGERVLRELVPRAAGDVTTAAPAAAILAEALRHVPPFDDAALMLMQFSAIPRAATARTRAALRKIWRFHSSDAYAAHTARLELTTYLRAFAANSEETFSAELVIGEILANTVEHAPGIVEIDLDWTGERPVLVARDAGPGFELRDRALPIDPLDENGRGLFLIRTLAEDVTIRRASGDGTEIRLTLPIARDLLDITL